MRKPVPPELTILLPGGVPMSFQRIVTEGKPVTFRMGERGLGDGGWGGTEPVVRVRLTQPYLLGTFPVTQAQFDVWFRAAWANPFDSRPDHPAEYLDWFKATEYCARLTGSGLLPEGWKACLPTEAEWEYACRAGTETEYHTGDGAAALEEAGWFGEELAKGSTHRVGQKVPNDFGLYDMHGNVWEWCHDVFEELAYGRWVEGASDPGWATRDADYREGRGFKREGDDRTRVLRGGAWFDSAWDCLSARRVLGMPDVGQSCYGFRVCLVRGPAAKPRRGAPEPSVRTEQPAEPANGAGRRGTRTEAEGVGRAMDGVNERLPRRE